MSNQHEVFTQQVHQVLGDCASKIVWASECLWENNVVEARKKYYGELFVRLNAEILQQPEEHRALLTKFVTGLKKKLGLI